MSVEASEAVLLRLRDVAAVLNVSEWTVSRLVQAGALPAVRVSSSIRIDPADLSEYIKNHKTGTPAGCGPGGAGTLITN